MVEQRAPSKIPFFDSIEEEAEFWDTHSTEEFEDEWEPVDWTIGEVTSVWIATIEFDRPTWLRLSEVARRRGMDVNELARAWMMEGLERADAEAGDGAAVAPAVAE